MSAFKKLLTLVLSLGLVLSFAACSNNVSETDEPDNTTSTEETSEPVELTIAEKAAELISARNIRVVIGSTSTGGDTYAEAAIISQKLSEVLGKNVKVDATGSTAGFDAIERVSDGSTIMIFHDQAYLGYLNGVEGYRDIFNDFRVGQTVAINPGNAFAVPASSPYNSVQDIIDAAGAGEEIHVAIQPGGVSAIGFQAMVNAVKIQYPGMESNLIAYNTGGQSDKDQALFDGLADVINASVQANEQYTNLPAGDQKAMKFVWLTANTETLLQANSAGYGDTSREELLAFANPNSVIPMDAAGTNYTFDKEFYVLYNKDTSDEIIALYDEALAACYDSPEFVQQLKDAFFIPNYKTADEAADYLHDKMEVNKKIIDAITK